MANVSPVFHQSHCQRGVGVNARRDTYLPLGSRRKRIEKSAVQLNERIDLNGVNQGEGKTRSPTPLSTLWST